MRAGLAGAHRMELDSCGFVAGEHVADLGSHLLGRRRIEEPEHRALTSE
jgi:hypothetical protein